MIMVWQMGGSQVAEGHLQEPKASLRPQGAAMWPKAPIPSHCELIVIADNDNLQEPDDVKEYNVVLDSADLMWANHNTNT